MNSNSTYFCTWDLGSSKDSTSQKRTKQAQAFSPSYHWEVSEAAPKLRTIFLSVVRHTKTSPTFLRSVNRHVRVPITVVATMGSNNQVSEIPRSLYTVYGKGTRWRKPDIKPSDVPRYRLMGMCYVLEHMEGEVFSGLTSCEVAEKAMKFCIV